MGDGLMRIYHKLPAPMRNVAATLRGYQLRRWRYGFSSESLVDEVLERDRWAAERMNAYVEERLAYVLHRAATRVPYYREQWAMRRSRGDKSSFEHLENWPLLEKETLRINPRAFVADDCSTRTMFEIHTSGTTGKPLTLWRSRTANREYYALLEARFRRWHGVDRHMAWAILGGQVVVPPGTQHPPFWVWNRAMHQLYLSANHLSVRNIAAYVSALERYGVDHMVSYSSSATEMARQCIAVGETYGGFRAIVTNAEPLHPHQRELLEKAFGAPARETYGMAEIVAGASECQLGTLHLWPDLGRVEVFADQEDRPVPTGETGRLVCTGLVNSDMPLIRYVVGDRGSVSESTKPCACGRLLQTFGRIQGRSNDMLIAPDGRRVFWVNPVFYGMPIHEAQVVQERLDTVRVKYVPESGFTTAHAEIIADRLRARMGEIEVVMQAVLEIPRGPNGKFQAVVCCLGRSDATRSEG